MPQPPGIPLSTLIRGLFRGRGLHFWHMLIGAAFVLGVIFYAVFLQAPASFKSDSIVTVPKGATLSDIATMLEKEGLILSPFWFRNSIILFRGERTAMAGDYYFEKPTHVFAVARRVAFGDHRLAPLRVTLPEGTTAEEMAVILDEKIPGFNAKHFIALAKPKEGRLFPDTYFFLPTVKEEDIVLALERNFERQIATIEAQIERFGKPLGQIIVMASLLEEEARTSETRRIISGILWKRIAIGMMLQVDAVFPYILGKNTYEVTEKDLSFNSPYNTYRYEGLPPGAIANPGLDSILAAVTPIKTPYLYYLSDRAGRMYYARDFETHKVNKELYLNRR